MSSIIVVPALMKARLSLHKKPLVWHPFPSTWRNHICHVLSFYFLNWPSVSFSLPPTPQLHHPYMLCLISHFLFWPARKDNRSSIRLNRQKNHKTKLGVEVTTRQQNCRIKSILKNSSSPANWEIHQCNSLCRETFFLKIGTALTSENSFGFNLATFDSETNPISRLVNECCPYRLSIMNDLHVIFDFFPCFITMSYVQWILFRHLMAT